MPQPAFSRLSAVTVTGTVALTVLASCVIPGKSMSRSGGVEIIAGGSLVGNAGTKTLNIRWGATNVVQIVIAAPTNGTWRLKAIIMNNGAATTQLSMGDAVANNAITTFSVAAAENTANDITLRTDATLGNAGDSVVQNVWMVRPINGLLP